MNPLAQGLTSSLSLAYDSVARIAMARAAARAKQITDLSGGVVAMTTQQVDELGRQLRDEMLRDLTRDVRASLTFYVNTNQPIKG